jgi:ATP-dependent helicase HrpA
LVAEKDGVALRVLQHAGEAALAHRRGVRRLLAMKLGETTKVVRRNLPGIQAMTLQFAMIGSGESLRDDIIEAAIDRACFGEGAPPRSQQSFEACAERARGKLSALVDEVCARVAPILAAYQEVARLLPNAASPESSAAPWSEIRDHLARLVYPGFVSDTPWTQLGHLPRYLKAARLRIERMRNEPAKDRTRQAELAPHWHAYTARADADKARGARSAELERFRWLLEEWRVSLFAQELRTTEPVSAKKMAEQWAKVAAERA